MSIPLLDRRALNRALLARQMLLERVGFTPLAALERLIGLQAQDPKPPYVGLWSRLLDFRPEALGSLIEERAAVRIALMRSTIHLVGRDDCLALRSTVQPVISTMARSAYGTALEGVDLDALAAMARELLAERPLASSELGAALAERWSGREPRALAYAARAAIPLVQVPPRGVWGRSGRAVHATVDAWLGRSVAPEPDPEGMILRYLGAFGPASVADAQQWSGLARLGEVFERLRPRLRVFRAEGGRELFDVEDGLLPDPDTAAPVRLVAPFDNLVLAHADRSRVMSDEVRSRLSTLNGMVPGTVLLDGFVAGAWKTRTERRRTTLTLEPYRKWSRAERSAVHAEAETLLAFLSDGADGNGAGGIELLSPG